MSRIKAEIIIMNFISLIKNTYVNATIILNKINGNVSFHVWPFAHLYNFSTLNILWSDSKTYAISNNTKKSIRSFIEHVSVVYLCIDKIVFILLKLFV